MVGDFLVLIGAFFMAPFIFYTALIAVFFIVALILEANESDGDGWGWMSFLIIGAGVLVFNRFDWTLASLTSSITVLLYGIFIYFGVGTVWSFAKWYLRMLKTRDRFIELKNSFIAYYHLQPNFFVAVPKKEDCHTKSEVDERDEILERNDNFVSRIRDEFHLHGLQYSKSDMMYDPAILRKAITPQVSNHKSAIIQWIMFWPISFVWTMINDPLRRLTAYLFSRIRGTLQLMSERMFKDVI